MHKARVKTSRVLFLKVEYLQSVAVSVKDITHKRGKTDG